MPQVLCRRRAYRARLLARLRDPKEPSMTTYYRVRLGLGGKFTPEAVTGGFIGAEKLRRALAVIPSVQFFRYQVIFKLHRA